MLKIIGSLIILAAGFWFSFRLTSDLTNKLAVTNSLIEFTKHVRGSIYTARLPLDEIFASYTDPVLESCGFTVQLKTNGLVQAAKTVENYVTKRTYDSLINLSAKLGGINTETQLKLCEETVNILKEELSKQNDLYTEKKKMYRAMPILLATSLIIMTV